MQYTAVAHCIRSHVNAAQHLVELRLTCWYVPVRGWKVAFADRLQLVLRYLDFAVETSGCCFLFFETTRRQTLKHLKEVRRLVVWWRLFVSGFEIVHQEERCTNYLYVQQKNIGTAHLIRCNNVVCSWLLGTRRNQQLNPIKNVRMPTNT